MIGYSVWLHSRHRPAKAPRLLYAGDSLMHALAAYALTREMMTRGRLSMVKRDGARSVVLAARRRGAK